MEHMRNKLMLQNREALQLASNGALTHKTSTTKTANNTVDRRAVLKPSAAMHVPRNLQDIMKEGKNFKPVRRVSIRSLQADTIQQHEDSGEPLIIEGFHEMDAWPRDLFNIEWLLDNHGNESCCVRDVLKRSDLNMKLSEFIEHSRKPASETVRPLYYKDAHCPPGWSEWVENKELIPSALRPYNDNDLLRHLTAQEKVESLMCYLGAGGTLTPCHKDLCGSSGQNIMCYTENGGSSLWFMTATADAPVVAAFFQDELKSEIDWERCTISTQEFSRVPCAVYVAEQKLGDLVLVPPRSCHQVMNRGGLTIKTSWSRMTVRGLTMALRHELPIYRRVCRPEQYRVRSIVYRSMLQQQQDLSSLIDGMEQKEVSKILSNVPGILRKVQDAAVLLGLFDSILLEEFIPAQTSMIVSDSQQILEILQPRHTSKRKPKPSSLASRAKTTSSNFACDFCGSDIFQSFFECRKCQSEANEDADGTPGVGDGVILCSSCYVEGRTCTCASMDPVQYRPFSLLLEARNKTASLLRGCGKDYQEYVNVDVKTLRGKGKMRISEAAHSLWKIRTAPSSNKSKPNLACKWKHSVRRNDCLNCSSCRVNYCYQHLLRQGVHSVDAILSHKEGTASWHRKHGNSEVLVRSSTSVKDAEGTEDPLQRQAMMTLNYPRCLPLNPGRTQLGWYDDMVEPELPAPSKDITATAGPHKTGSLDRTAPNEPSREKGKAPLQRHSSISSLSSLSDAPLVVVRAPTNSLKKRRDEVFDCVLVPQRAKRATDRVDGSDSDRPFKRRKKVPKPAKKSSVAPDSDEDDRRVAEDYASGLAIALGSAHADAPRFSLPKATDKRTNKKTHAKPPVPPARAELSANFMSVTSLPKSVAPSGAQAMPTESTKSHSTSSHQEVLLAKAPTRLRGKRGCPPGLRVSLAPCQTAEPQATNLILGADRSSVSNPQTAESSLREARQPTPTLPSPPSQESSYARDALSRTSADDGLLQQVLALLQKYGKDIDKLTKEVQSMKEEQNKHYTALERRFEEESQLRAANELSCRRQIDALASKLNTEMDNVEQSDQRMHEDLATREPTTKTHTPRHAGENSTRMKLEPAPQVQTGPTTPGNDPNANVAMFNFLAAMPNAMGILAGNNGMARVNPYAFNATVPAQQPLTLAHFPAPPQHNQQPGIAVAIPSVSGELVPMQIYQPSMRVENDSSPPGGQSPYAGSVSTGKRRTSQPPSDTRGDYGDHSPEETVVDEAEDRHGRRPASSRAPSRPRGERSDHSVTQTRHREGQMSRPSGPNYHRHQTGYYNRAGGSRGHQDTRFFSHSTRPPTPQRPSRSNYPPRQNTQ